MWYHSIMIHLIFCMVIAVYGDSQLLTCYECFHTPTDESLFADPNASTAAPPPPSCPRDHNCTVDGGVCVYSKNQRKKHYDVFCLAKALAESDESGCWTDATDSNIMYCYCTSEFCNDVQEDLTAKFQKLDKNPFISVANSSNGSSKDDHGSELKALKDSLQEAIEENAVFANDVDVVPLNLSDYEEFLRTGVNPVKDVEHNGVSQLINSTGLFTVTYLAITVGCVISSLSSIWIFK